MWYLIILLLSAIVIAAETEEFEKKRSKGRESPGNEVSVEAPDMQFEPQYYDSYDDSYEPAPSPPKPSSKPSSKPAVTTQTSGNQGQVIPTKQSNGSGGVTTAISNKYVTIYPTIEKPRMEGKAQDNKHPYLITIVAITLTVMALGYF